MPWGLTGGARGLWLGAAASGLLLALCFPKADLGWLAWAALVPWLRRLLAPHTTWKEGLASGWLGGTAFFLFLLYWIYPTCRAGGVEPPWAALALLGLASLLALTVAGFGAGAALAAGRWPGHPGLPALVAAMWVAAEMVREHVLGFPWELLGYSQWRAPSLLQVTAWTGVHGLSFLLVWANAAAALALMPRRGGRAALKFLAPPLAAAGLVWGAGAAALKAPAPGRTVAVAVLQGNIPQYQKWDAESASSIRAVYTALAEEAAAAQDPPALVVWPESSLPDWLEPRGSGGWAGDLARRTGTWQLVGAAVRDPKGALNAAALIAPPGRIAALYAKRHLVPFGEYVPLQGLLGRWVGVLNELGGFTAGRSAEPLEHPALRLGASVCYETIFPDEARSPVKAGAAAIVNLTNDGWYLETAGPHQHLAMNALRAAENRRPLVRAANTGISAFFDARGRLQRRLDLGRRGVLSARVAADPEPTTFFTRFGEVFGWACLAAAAGALALAGYVPGRRRG